MVPILLSDAVSIETLIMHRLVGISSEVNWALMLRLYGACSNFGLHERVPENADYEQMNFTLHHFQHITPCSHLEVNNPSNHALQELCDVTVMSLYSK